MRWISIVAILMIAAFAAVTVPSDAASSGDWQACESSQRENLDQRIATCTTLLQNSPSKAQAARAYNGRGDAYLDAGRFDLALADYDEAIKRNPNYAAAFDGRCRARAYLGAYDAALFDCSKSIELRPTYFYAYNNRGNVWVEKGEYDKAIADYNRTLELKPNFPYAFRGLGTAYDNKGDYDTAIADFDRAIALRPDMGEAFAGRGHAYLKKQAYDNAIADLTEAMRLSPWLTWCEASLIEAQDAKAALFSRHNVPATGARVALIIGNAIYGNSPLVPNAAHDADDVAAELRRLGYKIIGNPKTDFSREEMISAIEAFKRSSVGASSAIVWYSGHGQEMREDQSDVSRDWVIPVDAKIDSKKDVAKNAIPLDDLKIAVLAAKSLRLVVIDACRNNTFYDGGRGTRGLSRVEMSPGVIVVYSTSPGNLAQDGDGRNSPFAQAFLETIRVTPKLDVRQLFGAVTGRTKNLTRGEQQPEIFSGIDSSDTLFLAP